MTKVIIRLSSDLRRQNKSPLFSHRVVFVLCKELPGVGQGLRSLHVFGVSDDHRSGDTDQTWSTRFGSGVGFRKDTTLSEGRVSTHTKSPCDLAGVLPADISAPFLGSEDGRPRTVGHLRATERRRRSGEKEVEKGRKESGGEREEVKVGKKGLASTKSRVSTN